MKTDRYVETGGIRWGESFGSGANLTWPFATLSADNQEIVISYKALFGIIRNSFRISRNNLKSIKHKKGILPFSTGVEIAHSNGEYPPYILFWSFHYQELRKQLESFGYKVEG